MRFERLRSGAGLAVLMSALAVEFADELVDGTKSAAMPLIRHDLALSYLQVGLLAAAPLIIGSLVELPVGVLGGVGARRRRVVLAGGLVFICAVLAAALAQSFAVLLTALVLFFPASGAYVSLTQSALLDAQPDRRVRLMAVWTLAGSAGDVAGPLLVAAVLMAGGSWRLAFVLVAAAATASWLATAATGRSAGVAAGREGPDTEGWPGLGAVIRISASAGAFRWLALLEVADLLLDVFSGFLALYLVAVVHASPAIAAVGVAVRLGAGLAGDALLVGVLERFDAIAVLRASVWATGLMFPAFLLVPGLDAKLAVLAVLSIATAPWYPVLQAELFRSLPGRSGLAVSLASASGLVGGLGPVAVGLLAERFGLTAAMAALCIVPAVMLAVPLRRGPEAAAELSAKIGSRDQLGP